MAGALWPSTWRESGAPIALVMVVSTCASVLRNARLRREELSALLDDARPLGYENVSVIGAAIKDIDEAHLWSFLRGFTGDAFDEATASGYPTAEVLQRDLLLATNNGVEVVPTTAGLLLFGHDERVSELLPRSAITATRFAGDSVQAAVVERVKLTRQSIHTLRISSPFY